MVLFPIINIVVAITIIYFLNGVKQKSIRRFLRLAVVVIGPVIMVLYFNKYEKGFEIWSSIFITVIIYIISLIAFLFLYAISDTIIDKMGDNDKDKVAYDPSKNDSVKDDNKKKTSFFEWVIILFVIVVFLVICYYGLKHDTRDIYPYRR